MFESLGITWSQFKAMKAVALDWVQLEPHQQLCETNEDFMYWLYSGDAQLRLSSGKSVQNVTAGSGYNGLLGELRFAQVLDKGSSAKSAPSPDIQAGGTGATLVRIHIQKLKLLMDQDDELSESIRLLLVKGMHEKLSALMVEEDAET